MVGFIRLTPLPSPLPKGARGWGGVVLQSGAIKLRQLADQYAHGPAVGDYMVQHQQQQMLVGRQAHQDQAQQRRLAQIEGPGGCGDQQAAGLRVAFGGGQMAEVDQR